MRRLTFILIGFVLIFCSCRSITLSNDIPADYDFKYDIYSHIRMYFRANLKYPSVDELRNFCWEIINEQMRIYSLLLKSMIMLLKRSRLDERIYYDVYYPIQMKFHLNRKRKQCMYFGKVESG